jgi:hypothetical protein
MTTTATAGETTRRGRGRRPAHPGGRRTRSVSILLNEPERAMHEEWMKTRGWPDVPEAQIMRNLLREAWQE